MEKYKVPKQFDYNVIVIGAGAAGLTSAYIASQLKAKVALVEKNKMGGDCLNTGCVPSKALIRSAKILHDAKRAKAFGLEKGSFTWNFSEVMARVTKVIETVAPHDSVERYTELGVDCFETTAEILTPFSVKIDQKVYTTKNIILAAGASPVVPDLPGLDKVTPLNSETVWDLKTLPKRLLVVGGGPIGCELAQCFARFGSKVTIVERPPTLLPREDVEVSKLIMAQFAEEGIEVQIGCEAKAIEVKNKDKRLICEKNGQTCCSFPFDEILIALGRKSNVTGYGLEKLGIKLNEMGRIEADPFLRTNYPNIFVCGDIVGPYQFTHTASHQAWYATLNALFHPIKKFKVDYRVIPWCTYTDPEVAHVGLNEKMAKAQNIAYEVTIYPLEDLDRAICDSETKGFVKVLTVPNKDKILGVTIVARHAGNLIAEFVLAMRHNLGLNKILSTIHIYPTTTEANKYVAGNWRKAHTPPKILAFLKWFHTFRRAK